jgi:hypothetical protein
VRVLTLLMVALLVAGCGSDGDEPEASGSRFDQCVDRVVERTEGLDKAKAERKARTTYCEPFAKRGWVHEDGTLAIDVVRGEATSEMCAAPRPQEPAPTTPCIDTPSTPLDCDLLDLVRRAEVQQYLKERQSEGALIRCEDGRPPEELGAD